MSIEPGKLINTYFYRDYALILSGGKNSFSRKFNIYSLHETAQRGIRRLYQQKKLEADEVVHYALGALKKNELYTQSSPTTQKETHACRHDARPVQARITKEKMHADSTSGKVRVTVKQKSLVFEQAPLSELLEQSKLLKTNRATKKTEAAAGEERYIFVTEKVWRQGHQLARRGQPLGLESGAFLTGRLMRDTLSPAVYVMIDACIEATEADEQKYSITFSGNTWSAAANALEKRRRRLNRPHEIFLGSVHGHNFLPGQSSSGERACPTCRQYKTCTVSTATVSDADIRWHRSVFTGQPWAILVLWGWTVRAEEAWQVYGLRDATLLPCPIRILHAERT